MSQEIEFSIMGSDVRALSKIRLLLDKFEAENQIRVHPTFLAWDTGWGELLKFAIYGQGPDVSEVGSTWVGDLIGMEALHPFSPAEVAFLGEASAFVPSAWQGGLMAGDARTWAIPWMTGARVLFYRRQLLERAGLNAQTAFESFEQLEATLRRLDQSRVEMPWVVPTAFTHTTLLNTVHWIWGMGGDLISADGQHVLFNRPQARAGLRAYFSLGRYIAPKIRFVDPASLYQLFVTHEQAAVTLEGPWMFFNAQEQVLPETIAQMGVALAPGVPFVGGSYLVAWKHSRKPEAALKLIRFLSQPEHNAAYCRSTGLLPARVEALSLPPYATEPIWQTAAAAIQAGRTLPATRLWGLIEERLSNELHALWTEILNNPDADLDKVLLRNLGPLAERLEMTLLQKNKSAR